MKFLRIILAASTLTGGTHIAVAQEQPAGAPGAGAPYDEEVIITGTRRQDRTVTESSAPIDVLSGAELAVQPSGNMLDSLSNLSPPLIEGRNPLWMPRALFARLSFAGCLRVECWWFL